MTTKEKRSLPGIYIVVFCMLFSIAVQRADAARGASKEDLKPQRIMLNITESPSTSVAVTWRTKVKPSKPQAQIVKATSGPNIENDAKTFDATTEESGIDAENTAFYHSVIFKSLEPNTVYAYRVGAPGNWNEWNQFRTASDKSEPFSFLYFGDPQTDIENKCSRVFREAFRRAPDAAFWLYVGDIVNTGEDDSLWQEFYNALGFIAQVTPQVFLPGNHGYKRIVDMKQVEGSEEAIKTEKKGLTRLWKPQFTLPENGPKGLEESAYYFDYQSVRFVMLNGNEGLEEQAKWLKKVLANDRQHWTIINIHQPFYSTAGDRDNMYHRMLFVNIFEKYKVDLVLQGHDHTYGRTYKVLNDRRSIDEKKGIVYVVSVSGPKQYDLGNQYVDLMAKRGENTQLYQVIRIDGRKLIYESYGAGGELFDSFTLEK